MKLAFTKMQGCANDYIYLDCRKTGLPENIADLSRKLSARRFSIGGDGIICICGPESPDADATMRIFNADGSEGMMCGNGIRCVAKYLFDNGIAKGQKVGEGRHVLHIDTKSGVKECTVITKNGLVSKVTVDMGKAELAPEKVPVRLEGEKVVNKPISIGGNVYRITCCSMGNPHCTVFVPSVDKLDLEDLGPKFEHDPMFPDRVNVEFVEVIDQHTLKARIWERGSGETMACGTGACASAVAAILCGRCKEGEDIVVKLRGGDLTIRVEGSRVWMTGEAVTVFEGTVTV